MRIRRLSAIFSILIFCHLAVPAQNAAFNFQGRLNDGSVSAGGSYDFQFKLFDAVAGGTQIGAAVDRPNLPLINGIFSTTLDFGANAFTGADRFLEISVRLTAGGNYVVLSPRQQINSAPFAIRSLSSDTADNSNRLGGIAASEYPTRPSISNTFINNENSPLSGLGGVPQAASFSISGNGTLGGTLRAKEIVAQTETGFFGLTQTDGTTTLSTYVGGSSSGAAGGWLGTRSNSPLFFFTNDGQPTMTVTGGNVGIGTTTPQTRLSIRTGSFDAYGFTQTNGTVTVGTFVDNNGGAFGTRSNNPLYFFTNGGTPQTTLMPGGEFGIGVTPQAGIKLDVGGAGRFITPNGNITFATPNGETGLTFSNANRADIRFSNGRLKLLSGVGTGIPEDTRGIVINPVGDVGIGTADPTQKLEVVGTIKASVLQITGGSDLAEHFEIVDEARPGMVVAIDPQNTGKLILARGAYNRQVAGVVSGANNLQAGMILPNLKQDGKSMPVALSGRVWVYCDAAKNAITPGDLLTTSGTPGYAMKVTKYKKANGAIIGKAMTELKSGTGLVLVLVSLQ